MVTATGSPSSATAGSTVPVLTGCEASADTVDVTSAPARIDFRLRISCSRNWDTPPFWFGHRGNEFPYPENTMLAFRKVVEAGLRMIELDVCTTSDNVLVVFHDWHDVSRRTNGTGPVDGYTYEELRTLDAGRYAGIQYAGEKIPSLEEVLRFALGNEVVIMLNIKRADVDNIAALLDSVGFPERLTWFLTDIDEDRDAVNGRFPTAMHIHWVGDKYKTPFEQTEESMAEHKAAGVDGYTFIDWGAEARWTAEEIDYIQARGIFFGVNTPRAVLVPPYLERGADLFLIGNPAQAPLDLTPLAGGTIILHGPGGETVESAFDLASLAAGKPVLGEFVVPVELPAGLRPGSWTVGVTLVDDRGNRTAFGGAAGDGGGVQPEPMPAGAVDTLQIENSAYVPPPPLPYLASHRIEPVALQLRRAMGEVLVRVEGHDPVTGVHRLRARLVSPDGTRQFDSGWNDGEGTGSAETRISVPPGTPRGEWSVVAHVAATDGSERELDLGRVSVINLDPYLSWAEGEFSALPDGALSEAADEEADLDGDGLPNLVEFAVGASAGLADPSAAGLRIVWGDPVELRFHAHQGGSQVTPASYEAAGAGLRYTIERFVPGSPDGEASRSGAWVDAGEWIGGVLPDLPPDLPGVAPGIVLRRVELDLPGDVFQVLLRLRIDHLPPP